jgi:hypothetical protein
LILTTSSPSAPIVDDYFRTQQSDAELLQLLVSIALEGDDAGDAPWAAANTLADFPAAMLLPYRKELTKLSKYEWSYIREPALRALAKLDANGT